MDMLPLKKLPGKFQKEKSENFKNPKVVTLPLKKLPGKFKKFQNRPPAPK